MFSTLLALYKQMMEMTVHSCCCCRDLSSWWEETQRANKYMGEIVSVTRTLAKHPADCAGQPSKMDISLLEEQYYSIKEKQKQQTHIIVYKTGKTGPIPRESPISTNALNKRSQKLKALNGHIPVRGVTLEVSGNCSLQDQNATWHTHLDVHRLVQVDYHNTLYNTEPAINTGIRLDTETDKPAVLSNSSTEAKTNFLDSRRLSNTSTQESQIMFPSIQRKVSLKSITPTTWSSHTPTKLISVSNKYYPFPQKKTPKISEVARQLGLYVTHQVNSSTPTKGIV
ncbi:uncharacterized protein C9orf152 homolog [Microcaecilia unicolor]|uniref:Uncharacterized protein C9orf152 homolog n=1 Tax=Microcaecilia unicolor TaxID=1415580 RepID=A0A6P7WRF9_9AMPH|nr:uncharacterized protein C9orf152 homolog [Microcaecilia unicolor]